MADETEKDFRAYLDPDVLTAITNLDIRAKRIVEGFISGLHKSPFHGFSVEFAQHREYSPGDDIRHIDWKVFGKSDRFVIKEYEEETNLKANLLIDVSESMRYQSGKRLSKLDFAATIAASLAYLLLRQKDSAGMVLFDDEIRKVFPPSNRPSYLRDILTEVARIEPTQKTDVGPLMHRLAEELGRSGLLIIFSDLFCDLDSLFEAIKHFRFNRHEILIFHVMDEDELTFPFQQNTLFRGLEKMPHLLTEPRSLRRAYLDAVGRFLRRVELSCRENNVDYLRLSTGDRLEIALSRFLAARTGALRR